ISVAPYLSITDQTADSYQALLGAGAILEHHSDAARHDNDATDAGGEDPQVIWRRLAAQTWDAPVVVTTAVQFFESLFSNRTSRCRKNHRIAKSVIILDEVQTLPVNLLDPMLDMLRLLIAHAGVSVVLCTATQPAFERMQSDVNLPSAFELAPNPKAAFIALKRVSYSWPDPDVTQSWDEIAGILDDEHQVLAVMNTRKDALTLLEKLDDSQALHLSTLLCPDHRRAVIATIKDRLRQDDPCRVVATQVVEAGVDLDFPVVVRAIGPLDRIVQAAGRCNREGELDGFGSMIVVNPAEGGVPSGVYRTATDLTKIVLREGEPDPDDPETMTRYFARLFKLAETDHKKIQEARRDWKFRKVAELFRMIPDDGVTIIVPYLPSGVRESPAVELRKEVLESLKWRGFMPRKVADRVQAFSVSVPWRVANAAINTGLAEELTEGLAYWNGRYHPVRGIDLNESPSDGLFLV
ncbi:MAG: CRISPR-associated helicase/endonuclease Cas3, partial [Thermomicrobiales bacterium]